MKTKYKQRIEGVCVIGKPGSLMKLNNISMRDSFFNGFSLSYSVGERSTYFEYLEHTSERTLWEKIKVIRSVWEWLNHE